jgi:TRAP-type uncharacterized transport system fused permease subunit
LLIFILAGVFYIRRMLGDIYNDNLLLLEIDGFATVLSIFSLFTMGIGMMAMSLLAPLKWIDKNSYIIAIVAVAVSLPLSYWVLNRLEIKAAGLTECSELRRSSRLHSSKTYAITPEACQSLVNDRQAREL